MVPTKRICPTCGKEFVARKDINIFCQRKCFKKAYAAKMKEKAAKENKFPIYKCPKCKRITQLTFDPAKKFSPWLAFKCELCGILMISVCEELGVDDSVIA